jgi:hypothetical protein
MDSKYQVMAKAQCTGPHGTKNAITEKDDEVHVPTKIGKKNSVSHRLNLMLL